MYDIVQAGSKEPKRMRTKDVPQLLKDCGFSLGAEERAAVEGAFADGVTEVTLNELIQTAAPFVAKAKKDAAKDPSKKGTKSSAAAAQDIPNSSPRE